jgi:polysaccharide deacetylase 2 family uncharacterized protein YibQ
MQTLVIILLWVRPPKKLLKVAPLPLVKARIAIVLDDWGYNLNNLEIANQIKHPLTMSVLPGLSYSKEAAEELHGMGFEIILHLPMEPHEKYRLEKNTIMTSFEEAGIKKIMDRDLNDIPYAKGVSNHMGSKATGDTRTMEIVFKELKKRHLYFLDSFVSPKTICFGLSRKMGLSFAKRDVFLDNKEEYAYITGQLNKLKLRAKIKGSAVGIGHDRNMTLTILKELMPQIEKEGYQFVFLSELVK